MKLIVFNATPAAAEQFLHNFALLENDTTSSSQQPSGKICFNLYWIVVGAAYCAALRSCCAHCIPVLIWLIDIFWQEQQQLTLLDLS